jgi:predicted HNH restriction endonuclease
MDESLLTAKQVRAALDPTTYARFRQLSGTTKQRNKMKAIRKAWPVEGWWCAGCGRRIRRRKLQLHHITHVAAGGETTLENLILICHPCHKLVHQGCASVDAVHSARERHESRRQSRELHDTMRDALKQRCKTAEGRIQWLVDDGQYPKALKENRRRGGETLRTRIREIEILRRSCGAGALERASRLWDRLVPDACDAEQPSQRSWHSYEGGYVALLLGHPRLALERFRAALAVDSENGGPSPEREGPWLSAAGMVVQCLIADGRIKSDWTQIRALVDRAHEIIARSPQGDDTKKRWVDNWRWHDVRIWLARGDNDRCMKALRLAQSAAQTHDLDTKHDRLGLAIRVSTEGAVTSAWAQTPDEVDAALKTLAQALILQIYQQRRYPEMIRDVLFGISHCLRKQGEDNLASQMEAIANRTRDGSSWLHPYVASS